MMFSHFVARSDLHKRALMMTMMIYSTLVTSNVTSVTKVRSASARLFAGTWRPLVSVITTLYYVAIIFHRRVWYRALSLRYACIRSSSSGIILIS